MNMDDERVMRERWERALKRSLTLSFPPMPMDLREELLASARRRARRPPKKTPWAFVAGRAAFSPWVWGVGAAFAAGIIVLALKIAESSRQGPSIVAIHETSPNRNLAADLWSDDDGQDHDK